MATLSQADVDAIVDAFVAAILKRSPLHPQTPAQTLKRNPGPQGMEEFGLFEPDLAVDDRNPAGDIVTVGKDSIYRNVDAFCERIRDAISTKGPEPVRDDLHLLPSRCSEPLVDLRAFRDQ